MDATPGSRRRFLVVAGSVAIVGAAVILIWFQPQKLLIDERVNETRPGTLEGRKAGAEEGAMSFSGDFRSLAHETSGSASLTQGPDGRYYVRLEDFSTENGPDLFVYLSTAPASAERSELANEFIDLGPLKGNVGSQNYLVPDGVDLDQYHSVLIWCRRFTTGFGIAPFEASQ